MHPYNKLLQRYRKAEQWLDDNPQDAEKYIGEFEKILKQLNDTIKEYGIKKKEILRGVRE